MDSLKHKKLPELTFIIGMGRSGTTLLTNMLNSNPYIISSPENEFILFTHQAFKNRNFEDSKTITDFINIFNFDFNKVSSFWIPTKKLEDDINSLSSKEYSSICKLVYLNYPFANKNTEQVISIVDKNPIYSLYLNELNRLFPEAKYIVLTRDYRDNILSRKKYTDKKTSVFQLAGAWNYFYDCIFRDIKKYNLNYNLLRYEDLVENPDLTLRKICSFLNVEFTSEMLNYQNLATEINNFVKEKATPDLYTKLNAMHHNLEKPIIKNRVKSYMNELSKDEIFILDYVCHKYANKFNYEFDLSKQIKWQWVIRKYVSLYKVKVYYFLQSIYYKTPLRFRLMFLTKK